MAELRGVPAGGQLWKAGNKWFVVYFVPGSEPPVPLAWSVSDDELANIAPDGGPAADRTFRSMAEAGREGMLTLGQSEQLLNTTDDPFRTFVSDYERQARALPMLQDPDVLALFAGAQLEGRTPTVEELRLTDWWQSRTAGEREWATLTLQDPATARQMLDDRRVAVRQSLRQGGVDPTSDLVEHLATRWASGKWTQAKVSEQINALSDPYAGIDLDSRVAEIARGYDPTGKDQQAVAGGAESIKNRIRAMFNNRDVDIATHLEPNVTEDPESRLERLTQEVMSGETTLDNIRQTVRRMAGLHPLTDLDIDRSGEEQVRQGLFRQVWEQEVDETDPLFLDIMRMAAPGGPGLNEAAARLRREGVERGVSAVTQQMSSGILRATGGDVRRAV